MEIPDGFRLQMSPPTEALNSSRCCSVECLLGLAGLV